MAAKSCGSGEIERASRGSQTCTEVLSVIEERAGVAYIIHERITQRATPEKAALMYVGVGIINVVEYTAE